MSPATNFNISLSDGASITDAEIWDLLNEVYVEAGYTPAVDAATMFEPTSVRQRGMLFAARKRDTHELAGFIILVPPGSPAIKLAQGTEAEIHLLGVKQIYRGQGLGQALISTAIEQSAKSGHSRLILWTQPSMISAQKLYEAAGFRHTDMLHRNDREYKVYVLDIV